MKLIGCTEAARYLAISPELVRLRATRGRIRIARRSPLRFRVADIIEHARTSTVRPYTRKPTVLELLAERAARISLAGPHATDPTAATSPGRRGVGSSRKDD